MKKKDKLNILATLNRKVCDIEELLRRCLVGNIACKTPWYHYPAYSGLCGGLLWFFFNEKITASVVLLLNFFSVARVTSVNKPPSSFSF